LFPTTVELLLNKRTTRKQIETTTSVASPGLGFKMRAIKLVLQEIMTASRMMHVISSMPSIMDVIQMKLIGSRPSVKI
jgi:hypothetical protein